MRTRNFGNTGMQVSALGLGGAEIGFEHCSDRSVDELLGVATDLGLNVIDTAAMYGPSESLIGRAMRGRRQRFFIFTKCGRALPPKSSFEGLLVRLRPLHWQRGDNVYRSSWHPRVLRWNIEQSLRRLRTDYVDVIQLHSCDIQTLTRGDILEVLFRARQSGKARFLGFSGDGETAVYAIQSGLFQSIQLSVNIADQQPLDNAIPAALERGMGIVAKRPIANGIWRSATRPTFTHLQAYWDRLQKLRYECLRGSDAFASALRFTLSLPIHTAIVGTTNLAHLRENALIAAAGSLSLNEMEAIRNQWNRIAQKDWVGQM